MTPDRALAIRRAQTRDADVLGRLGASLMHTHFAFDPQRFLSPGADADRGYASFLRAQLDNRDSVILVAEIDRRVVGYVFAGLEPLSWKEVLPEIGSPPKPLGSADVSRNPSSRLSFIWTVAPTRNR